MQLIKNCSNFFADPNEKLTYNTNVAAEIKTITDSPVYSNYTNYPTSMKDEVEKQVKQLLDDGIIRPSRSPYCSPVWRVKNRKMLQRKENSGWS